MRIVVTRPQIDSERTAAALHARGHSVLIAPLMQVEPIVADLAGNWNAIVITSANAPAAIAGNPACAALQALPVFAVGRRSAEAARAAGFENVIAAGGDVHDLVQLIAEKHPRDAAPVLYLAGEDRAADLVGELAAHRVACEMHVVYRAVTAPFPPELIAALQGEDVGAVLHFSRRSAENFIAGARHAGVMQQALDVRHYCLARPIAEPLAAAGAADIAVAERPDEAGLLALIPPPA